MILKDFFESNDKLVIHCNSIEKANKFGIEADKLGYKWCSGQTYENTSWEDYKENTCYTNEGTYGPISYYQGYKSGYTIIKFEDIERDERNDKYDFNEDLAFIDKCLSLYKKELERRNLTQDRIYFSIRKSRLKALKNLINDTMTKIEKECPSKYDFIKRGDLK